jgi:hypothetical protein
MIPRLAALSIAAMAARICSALGVPEECTCFCIVRSRATALRLRSDRFKVWRARLEADLVLAMIKSNFADVDARGAIAIVNFDKERTERASALCTRIGLNGYCALIQHRGRFAPLCFLSFSSERSRHAHLLDAEPLRSRCRLRLLLGGRFLVLHNQGVSGWRRSRLWHFGQSIGNDLHQCPQWDLIVQHGDVAGLHSYAAVAGWTSDCLFFRCAVNVDTAMKSLRVLRFKAAQPDDPRGHRIAARSIWLENFAGQPPIVEDGADWRVVSDFLRDHEITEGCRHSPSKIA